MSDTVVVEGEVTRILYAAPEGLSSLQVHRNYQMALRDAGAERVFECLDECEPIEEWVYGDDEDRLYNTDPSWLASEALYTYNTSDERYFLVRIPASDGDILVSAYTALHSPPNGHKELYDQPITILQIVEEKPMATGKVEADLSAEVMAEDLNEAGTARLYGIHFATDEATIEPESESTLAEIAVLLSEHPDLALAVVGHTDHRGSLDHNMTLSQQRAEAVVDYLVSEHGIAQSRLDAHGVGPLAPVATNETDDGRARNRRVELVKQP